MGPCVVAAVLLVVSVLAPPAWAATFPTGVCPNILGKPDLIIGVIIGTASDCTEDLTITDATLGSPLTVALRPDNGTAGVAYDGDDDVLVGVLNASRGSVTAISLTGVGAFGFDGDGISIFTGAPTGVWGYEGPDNTFVVIDQNDGLAVFNTPLLSEQTAYFSLELPVTGGTVVAPPGGSGSQTGAPEPTSLALLGSGFVGLRLLRRRF